ncbi:MAG: aspartate/glutamate racemase family protein [Hyphomicrobiales bacterium]
MPRELALLNPNTNKRTTDFMTAIANSISPHQPAFEGHTMLLGPSIVTNEPALASAANQIVTIGENLARHGIRGILISGFGDPGLTELRQRVSIPVTGIAEAGMRKAGKNGRRFSIITTTPALHNSIEQTAARYGHANNLVSIRITDGEPTQTMSDPQNLTRLLLDASHRCIQSDGAQALLIGGGPLAIAAKAIEQAIEVPIIEPVTEGAKLAIERYNSRNTGAAF